MHLSFGHPLTHLPLTSPTPSDPSPPAQLTGRRRGPPVPSGKLDAATPSSCMISTPNAPIPDLDSSHDVRSSDRSGLEVSRDVDSSISDQGSDLGRCASVTARRARGQGLRPAPCALRAGCRGRRVSYQVAAPQGVGHKVAGHAGRVVGACQQRGHLRRASLAGRHNGRPPHRVMRCAGAVLLAAKANGGNHRATTQGHLGRLGCRRCGGCRCQLCCHLGQRGCGLVCHVTPLMPGTVCASRTSLPNTASIGADGAGAYPLFRGLAQTKVRRKHLYNGNKRNRPGEVSPGASDRSYSCPSYKVDEIELFGLSASCLVFRCKGGTLFAKV